MSRRRRLRLLRIREQPDFRHLSENQLFALQQMEDEVENLKRELMEKRAEFEGQKQKLRRRPERKVSGSDQLDARSVANLLHDPKTPIAVGSKGRKASIQDPNDHARECKRLIDQAANEYRVSNSVRPTATKLGVSYLRLAKLLSSSGINLKSEIAKEWKSGSSLRKLSAKHGVTPQTLSSWIKSTGVEVKSRNSNPRYDEDQLRDFLREGRTTNWIATEMRISWATVQGFRDRNP